MAEKVKHRLEQLDDFEEGSVKEMLNLTQQEYISQIEQLNVSLMESWKADQRVKALKLVIQCAKLLADVNVMHFYPSKFVLITEILDNFGQLVYKRICDKKEGTSAEESAKETCKNWFYKIASIREMIPRFYVETAILRNFKFLVENQGKEEIRNQYCSALKRLNQMIRGFGDPLVATYARCYLCRVGIQIAPQERTIYTQVFTDFLLTFKQVSSPFVRKTLEVQKVPLPTYFGLFSPALDFILQCVAHKANDSVLNEILVEFKAKCETQGCPALILNSFLISFPPNFIASRPHHFLEMIMRGSDSHQRFPQSLLIKNLGNCFISVDDHIWNSTTDHQTRLQILNEAWKLIDQLEAPQEYVSSVEVWIEFVVKYFGPREINMVIKELIRHMQPERAFENHYNQLINILSKIVNGIAERDIDFSLLFSMDSLMPYLDLMQKESVKVEACKLLVGGFNRHFKGDRNQDANSQDNQSMGAEEDEASLVNEEKDEILHVTNDAVILSCLMYLCKTMHDSIDAECLEDEKRVIGDLIKGFIRRVSFKRDFEAQLNFYVECRATFSNLEQVLAHLVHCVSALAMTTRQIMKGQHTKKTAAFIRACMAYNYITIPSIENEMIRLQLYVECGQVALLNNCLPQCDAFLKGMILIN